jgi:8-oxo-dGTP pyrophosphatase MutT (NUDIX family)
MQHGKRERGGRRVVSAGGVVYRRVRGDVDVLLAGRRRSDGEMVWSIPKGQVEAGESVRDTAVREVQEETGIRGEIEVELGEIRYTYATYGGQTSRRRVAKQVHFFLMRCLGGRFADRDEEMDVVKWVSIESAEATMTYENERVLLRRARALIGGHEAG